MRVLPLCMRARIHHRTAQMPTAPRGWPHVRTLAHTPNPLAHHAPSTSMHIHTAHMLPIRHHHAPRRLALASNGCALAFALAHDRHTHQPFIVRRVSSYAMHRGDVPAASAPRVALPSLSLLRARGMACWLHAHPCIATNARVQLYLQMTCHDCIAPTWPSTTDAETMQTARSRSRTVFCAGPHRPARNRNRAVETCLLPRKPPGPPASHTIRLTEVCAFFQTRVCGVAAKDCHAGGTRCGFARKALLLLASPQDAGRRCGRQHDGKARPEMIAS